MKTLWVARDQNGRLSLFFSEPRRSMHWWFSDDNEVFELPNTTFPALKWEDEPIRVKLVEVEAK